MVALAFTDCAQPLAARLVGSSDQLSQYFSGFSIDTRTLQAGDLYIAIKGDRFDGHDFISAAQESDAIGLLVDHPVESSLPQIVVSDTRKAIGELAKLWASLHQVQTIAITGSNGKTTVKEIVSSILQQAGSVLATRGNFNNDIGVPLTLFRLQPEHRFAVIEMGADHAGEIEWLSYIAQPDVALVNNVGPAHLEGFGSIENIADAKSEIYLSVKVDGWAVVNADDHFAVTMQTAANHLHLCTFGYRQNPQMQSDASDLQVIGIDGDGLRFQVNGEESIVRFQLPGQHNQRNALAAVAAVSCLGIDSAMIIKGLENVQPVEGRLQLKPGYAGATLIDDTYNANPTSARAAIDVLAAIEGQRHLVLGDMLELGDDASQLHADVGSYARECGIEALSTVGTLAMNAARAFGNARHFESQSTLVEHVRGVLDRTTTVLVKGSRSSHMEHIVEALQPSEAVA